MVLLANFTLVSSAAFYDEANELQLKKQHLTLKDEGEY